MSEADYKSILAIVGAENISRDELDLLCYSRDMAPLPDELLKSYGMLEPEFVVRPKSVEHISKIMEYAYENNLPITLRGGGSWALGGTIPVEGGVVLDLCGMDKIIELNEEDQYVRVQTGVVWKQLIDYLDRKGFQVGANPTSSPSATVGGFIATGGGGGIGVAKYGPLGDQVISMKVVLSDGKIIETTPFDSWYFVGSEGTLGGVCEVTLKIFPRNEKSHYMFGFDSIDIGMEAFMELYSLRPYYLTFADKGFIECLNEKEHNLPVKEITLIATFDEDKEGLAKIDKKIKEKYSVAKYEDKLAKEEWDNRFKVALSIKSLGPTMFSPEIQVPIRFLKDAFLDLKKLLKPRKYAIEGMVNSGGMVTILPIILTDERNKTDFMKVFSYTRDINKIGYKYYGCVYGIGLHNTTHMKRIHGNGLEVMRALRKEIDPKVILNPSKTTQIRILPCFQNIFMIMMRFVPTFMGIGLKLTSYIPSGLVRWGLRVIGGQLR